MFRLQERNSTGNAISKGSEFRTAILLAFVLGSVKTVPESGRVDLKTGQHL
jgi:hypothetical protein